MLPRRTRVEWTAVALCGLFAVFVFPRIAPFHMVITATICLGLAILALSLAFVWGYGGILCLGQAAFFGLGGYAWAVGAWNFDSTLYAAILAVAVPAVFAAALGYFMFYGRLNDVCLAVVTLSVTLILFKLVNSTGGDAWAIGKARLGGFNGMPGTPLLANPVTGQVLSPHALYTVTAVCLFACYGLCKAVLASPFGRVVVAIRENETRAGLLGYDTRRHKLVFFSIGAGIAGVSGLIFANAVFVAPTMFDMASTARIFVWVIVGGAGTLVGPVIGCIVLLTLTSWLGTAGLVNPDVVLGAVLTVFVLLVPRGLLPLLNDGLTRGLAGRRRQRQAAP